MSEDVRPEVVQIVFGAMIDPTAASVEHLRALGSITPSEKAAAESLYFSAAPFEGDRADRTMEALDILFGDAPDAARTPWPLLLERLSQTDVERLREMYDALPEGARAEFDAQYGRPEL